jgi:glycosyltransferase involved in cell wall biosynthesis
MLTVSVIIPSYFRFFEIEKYLFPSLMAQSYSPVEIIIVDDTPDDSVEKICNKWKNTFIKAHLIYVRNPQSGSSARAKNYGMKIAKGDLLMSFDSDVLLDKHYIKNIVEVFESNPKAVGVQGFISNMFDNKLADLLKNTNLNKIKYILYKNIFHNFFWFFIPTINSCRLNEYPLILNKIIECDWLSGSNMTIGKTSKDFHFETSYDGYSPGVDVLLSIKLKNAGNLYITPLALCQHLHTLSGRHPKKTISSQEKDFFSQFGARGIFVWCIRQLFSEKIRSYLM